MIIRSYQRIPSNPYPQLLRPIFLWGFALFACMACACSNPLADTDQAVRIFSYNAQTLFDDVLQGNEFPEFRPSLDGWGSREYHGRLRNLARVIRESCPGGPDIVVLQEIENLSVLQDLRRYFLRGLGYHDLAAGASKSASMGIGVLSRHPISSSRLVSAVHPDTSLRPALELEIRLGENRELRLFAVHWKSKRGDSEEETEPLRLLQAHSLISRIEALKAQGDSLPLIIAGDFNETLQDFSGRESLRYATATVLLEEYGQWRDSPGSDGLKPVVVSIAPDPSTLVMHAIDLPGFLLPLENLSEESVPSGSYHYDGSWELIDQILISPSMLDTCFSSARFFIVSNPCLVDSGGRPRRWSPGRSGGFSDHLPVLLELFP